MSVRSFPANFCNQSKVSIHWNLEPRSGSDTYSKTYIYTSNPNLANNFSLKVADNGATLMASFRGHVHSFFVWRHYTCPCVPWCQTFWLRFLRSLIDPRQKGNYIQPNYRGRKQKYAVNHIVPFLPHTVSRAGKQLEIIKNVPEGASLNWTLFSLIPPTASLIY